MSKKPGLTLNAHGKHCLKSFLYALSSSDLDTSQMDYLIKKDLIDSVTKYKDWRDREECARHCLTDLGMETAKRYFPNYKNWD